MTFDNRRNIHVNNMQSLGKPRQTNKLSLRFKKKMPFRKVLNTKDVGLVTNRILKDVINPLLVGILMSSLYWNN